MENLLILENNEELLRPIIKAVDQTRFYIDIAESLEKCYELVIKLLPAIIICKQELYSKESNEIFRKLRSESFISKIPIIFISGPGNIHPHKNQEEATFDFYISTGFKTEELSNLIDDVLEKTQKRKDDTEKSLNELRGSLSFSLPHEFFTPLNGILGFSEILLKEYDNLPKAEIIEMLTYIKNDSVRLKQLTENFLSFAQLDMISKDKNAVASLRKSYFINPKEIISSVSSQIAQRYDRQEDLVLELDDAAIRISEEYMKKLTQELIDNAFKFSEKNQPIIISLFSNDSSSMISVVDQGIGLTPEQISSIGAYMQFNRKIHEQQGSGLGLIIAKRIVELHGGEFNIESNVNENTKVSIIFDR